MHEKVGSQGLSVESASGAPLPLAREQGQDEDTWRMEMVIGWPAHACKMEFAGVLLRPFPMAVSRHETIGKKLRWPSN